MVLLYVIAFSVLVIIIIAFSIRLSQTASKLRDPIHVWKTLARARRLRPIAFSFLLRYAIPYTSGIHFRVTTLDKGLCSAILKEEKRIHNPFNSIHAAALCTFGETIGGLAVFSQLSKKDRAIITRINCEYFKKARGPITATCNFNPGFMSGKVEKESEVILNDAMLEPVAKITVYWFIECKSE
ncbi:7246_t:CDS:2 [Ambispora gerdemannii]|uniref:7246_t:CDS:1 n=1 Tax=Ambispora gerdemannii TaxID=144530 RepID=A0A9N8YTV9_9GLOM|nr:7246_t:CDS:2 [Ambispora gerdemannii]